MVRNQSDVKSQGESKFSGQDARREFLKTSGRLAIAAPAVVLLLSAQSKTAMANDYTTEPPGG